MRVNAAPILALVACPEVVPVGKLNVRVVTRRLIGVDARPADVLIQQTGNRQALSRTNSASSRRGDCAGHQAIIRVDLLQVRPLVRVLPIGRRHHHQLDHMLEVPWVRRIRGPACAVPLLCLRHRKSRPSSSTAGCHELAGQPVQQLRVARPFALCAPRSSTTAEMPGAEELFPEPVHDRPRRQRVLRRHQPARQVKPSQAPCCRVREAEAENAASPGSTISPLSSCQLPRGKTRVTSAARRPRPSVKPRPPRHSRTSPCSFRAWATASGSHWRSEQEGPPK